MGGLGGVVLGGRRRGLSRKMTGTRDLLLFGGGGFDGATRGDR